MVFNRHRLVRYLDSRWFALADLLCVAGAGAIWVSRPSVGGWPLVLVLIPWPSRTSALRLPIQRTSLDLPIAVFLLTAGVGVWVANDYEAAWAKFWVLAGASLLFYALARQPGENLWLVATLFGALGGAVAILFLMAHDWKQNPANITALNVVAVRWMTIRPEWRGLTIPPNVAGGVLAMLVSFPLAAGWRAWQRRERLVLLLDIGMILSILLGLAMTSSRGAWVALAVGCGLSLVWAASGWITDRTKLPKTLVLLLVFILISGFVLGFLSFSSEDLAGLAERFAQVPSALSRVDLFKNAVYLIADFPFTGGGLGAFQGLYSHYMMVIFVPLFEYSHNLYLDVAIEQGLFGLLALIVVFAGSFWNLWKSPQRNRTWPEWLGFTHWPIFVGLIVLILHGLVDDALYSERGTPLLFMLAGVSVAFIRNRSQLSLSTEFVVSSKPGVCRFWKTQWAVRLGIGLLATILGVLLLSPGRLRGALLANLGAVRMAQAELRAWPDQGWEKQKDAKELVIAEDLFVEALEFDSNNRVALHRLGLIAMDRRDYVKAVNQLEPAFETASSHRGIQKNLGYSYVWTDRLDQAVPILFGISEAEYELGIYAWWWGTQGREDLADSSTRMVELLSQAGSDDASSRLEQ